MTLEQAFRHVRSVRSIFPNIGFLQQLAEYERKLHGTGHCSVWRDHTIDGVTVHLPEFIIAEHLELYAREFDE